MIKADKRKSAPAPQSNGPASNSQGQTPAQEAKLQRAVEFIVANCGERFRRLLTSHPWLSDKIIGQLSRTSAERQLFELEQVQQGRRPFSAKGTVFDTISFREIGGRPARAGGYVQLADQLFELGSSWRRERSKPSRFIGLVSWTVSPFADGAIAAKWRTDSAATANLVPTRAASDGVRKLPIPRPLMKTAVSAKIAAMAGSVTKVGAENITSP